MTTHEINFPEEQATVRINFPNSEPLEIDAIELNWVIRDSLLDDDQDGSDFTYIDILRKHFKKAFGRDISRAQANYLLKATKEIVAELKKNSSQSQDLLDITDQLSQLRQEDSPSSNSVNQSSEQKKNSEPEKPQNP